MTVSPGYTPMDDYFTRGKHDAMQRILSEKQDAKQGSMRDARPKEVEKITQKKPAAKPTPKPVAKKPAPQPVAKKPAPKKK